MSLGGSSETWWVAISFVLESQDSLQALAGSVTPYLGLLISEQFLPCVVAAGRIKWQKKQCRVQDTGLGSKQDKWWLLVYCYLLCVGETLIVSSKHQCLRGFTECFQQRAGPHLFYSNSPAWPKVSSNKYQMNECGWVDG